MRFTKKQTVDVALKCQVCKSITEYPLNVFPRAVYKRKGYIMQFCCDGFGRPSGHSPHRSAVADALGNTPHEIVGVFVQKQIPLSNKEAQKLLGKLVM